jgi:two-component system chemotaxis sensor kinase CheA
VAARRKKKSGAPTRATKAKADASKKQDRREFVSEAEEILEHMLEDLSDLGERRQDEGDLDPELVNRIFRSAHSLKGLAGMFGMDAIGRLAHHMEDILDGLRLGRIAVDSPVIGLLDEGVGLLVAILTHVENANDESEDDIAAASSFIARIEEAVAVSDVAAAGKVASVASLDVDPDVLRALTEYEEHRLQENVRIGREISLVDSNFDIASFEDGLTDLSASIREVGEVISTLPAPGSAPDSQIRFSLLVATDIDTQSLAERIEQPDTEIRTVRAAAPVKPVEGDDTTPAESKERDGDGRTALPPPESTDIESLRSIGETIRVDVRKLDELMNLVGELVIQRNAIGDVVGRLSMDASTARIGADLGKIHVQLRRKLK